MWKGSFFHLLESAPADVEPLGEGAGGREARLNRAGAICEVCDGQSP